MPQPPTPPPGNQPEDPNRAACKRNENQARENCFQTVDVRPEFVTPCTAFVKDCMRYYHDDLPLTRAASLFNSRVGVGTGVGIGGIPYYPFNKEGSIGVGRNVGVDFGSWGAGVSDQRGVSDFFTTGRQVGANWQAGKYGATQSFGVPILPFISGAKGTSVSGWQFSKCMCL